MVSENLNSNSAAMVNPSTPITIAVDPIALVTTECITVTSAMRKHARWAHSSVAAIMGGVSSPTLDRHTSKSTRQGDKLQAGRSDTTRTRSHITDEEESLVGSWGRRSKKGKSMQDNPLMSAFARLRSDLRSSSDIPTFDTPSLLHPFLQVIRSSSTSASITSLAIVAITKFFDYKLISASSPRLALAMQLLCAAITHCRFEASDSAADEIVLLQILRLMESMFAGPGGNLLGDESVCEMMETGLSMCCQKRLSELVRRSAEMSMIKMCQVIFERLNTLGDVDNDHPVSRYGSPQPESESLTMNKVAVDGAPIGSLQSASGINQVESETLQDPAQTTTSALTNDSASVVRENGFAELHEPTSPQLLSQSQDNSSKSTALSRQNSEETTLHNESSNVMTGRVLEADSSGVTKPYSLPSIRELFRVLVDLLRPQNQEHNDALRVMALRIIDVALEVAGPSIAKHPSLASLAKDDLCRYLFQLIRTDSTILLNESLRVSGTLLATCREVLKLQQELFLAYLVECLHPQVEIPDEPGVLPQLYEGVPKTPKAASGQTSGRATPVPVKERHQLGMDGTSRKPDAREAMIESIGALSRIPSFFVELFINYDCEVDRNDLCEDLVGLLARNAFPDSATWSTTSVPPLSLDSLLGYVQSIAERLGDETAVLNNLDSERLRTQRSRKKIISQGATLFNSNPRDGIAYLAARGIIDNPNNPQSVATFLKSTTRIAKKRLGEYISKRDQEPLLRAFMDTFDFSGKRVDEALRDLLNSFRLPGESQLIERIVTVFSQRYYGKPGVEGIANEDAIFTLTYSIIMLNTDQHNPNLKKEKRMTVKDFARNLRGVNGGHDFDTQYLEEIFKSIKTNEIILPDEHSNDKAFDFTWEGMLVKAQNSGPMLLGKTNVFDGDMFEATWRPIIATLSYVFMSASDDAVMSRVIQGFDQCAQIAAKYDIHEALDRIIYCLSLMTTISRVMATNTALNTEVQVGKQKIMVSELAVKFGREYKAQLACAVLFRLLPGKEHCVKTSWQYIVNIWINLFTNSLLSSSLLRSQDLLGIPPISLQPPKHVVDREQRNESGILSSFTSYLSSYAADDPPEPSEEEVENSLCAIDCLASCPMDQIFENIISMPPNASINLLKALLNNLPEPASPVVLAARAEQSRPIPVRGGNVASKSPNLPAYQPSLVFVLEMSTILAGKNNQSLSMLGESVVDSLQGVVRDSSNVHPLMLSRSIAYLLRLMHVSQTIQDQAFLKTPVVLHTIAGFAQSTLEQSSDSILQGLKLCLDNTSNLRSEIINTPDFWLILSNLQADGKSAGSVFELVENIFMSVPLGISADNYAFAVSLLDNFASAGSIGASHEQSSKRQPLGQQQPFRDRRGQPPPETIRSAAEIAQDKEVVARGHKAVILLAQLVQQVPEMIRKSQLEDEKAWMTYWSLLFQKLQIQCMNPCRRIRRQAVSSLQTALFAPDLHPKTISQWTLIFHNVLLGLLTQLLKDEVYQSDPAGMNETRLQAANLLCRTFLHHLPSLSQQSETELLKLWLEILNIMDRLLHAGQGENLEEAIPETLKNILLVMQGSSSRLVPPIDAEDISSMSTSDSVPSALWTQTVQRIDKFLPNLVQELFPIATKHLRVSAVPREEQLQDADSTKEKTAMDQTNDSSSDATAPDALIAESGSTSTDALVVRSESDDSSVD